jgi:hypothetical protein
MKLLIVAILALIAPAVAFGQVASDIRLGYPDGGFVEIVTDSDYCLKSVTVSLRGVNIKHQKIDGVFCNLHLQEASLSGESYFNTLEQRGSYEWEIVIPFGLSKEDFSTVAGDYQLVLGKDRILKINSRYKSKVK